MHRELHFQARSSLPWSLSTRSRRVNACKRNSLCIFQSLVKFSVICCLLLLAACATQRTRNLQHLALEDIHHWNAKGKISVTVDSERKTANFSWLNDGEDFDIRLHGPFGSGAARLEKRGERVSYNDGKQRHLANSAAALLEEATGWVLPIEDLHWWIKGLPAPDTAIVQSKTGSNGHLQSLQQQGWNLQFRDYQESAGHLLPGKILANRNDLRLVIAIKEWELKSL